MPTTTLASINTLNPDIPVVGKIFGSFCGYCTAMAADWAIATTHAKEHKVPILDLQTDGTENIESVLDAVNAKFVKFGEKLKYRTVPTIFTIRNGNVVYHTGARDSATLCKLVDSMRVKAKSSHWTRKKSPIWKKSTHRRRNLLAGGKSRRRFSRKNKMRKYIIHNPQ
jgi:hypothetical protein